ncbi:thermonuclease family protein [Rhizobium oryzicola]|uniref:Thermonuclease family protein n=2 Tax=Rhizobium oryzicola TaxID=1232668 RepID=A0ABT8T420_9HYPH|nr:thermonuclease family protein [Rhizobium oryzicola]MDO1585467.1 thermonuclease family protein [Rhizobium oryzicola]
MVAMISGLTSAAVMSVSAPTVMLAAPHMTSEKFGICTGGHRTACVIDGDTLWIDGTKVRIADIDAPEISEPKCASELALGNRATQRLIELVNQGPFELQAWPGRDKDRYGRALRVLVRHGHSLGDVLVSEGLARSWTGRREPWC